MIKASRVGHATFEYSDLDKAIAYYTEVNGLALHAKDNNSAFLASKTGLLTIALERGSTENLRRLSFEVSPHADFTEIAKKLAAAGVNCETRSDAVPGIGKMLAFDDPTGTTIECSRNGATWVHITRSWARATHARAHRCVVENPKAMADSTAACWVSGYRTGSRTISFSCAATPIITQ